MLYLFLMFAVFFFVSGFSIFYIIYNVMDIINMFKKKFVRDDFVYYVDNMIAGFCAFVLSGACAYFWWWLENR